MQGPGDEQFDRARPEIDDLMGSGTERDDGLRLASLKHVEKLVPPVLA